MAKKAGSLAQERFAEVSLPDSDGNERRLSEFWQDNPVVFVWLRHYG